MALKDWRKTPEFRDAAGKWISQDFYKGDKFISVWKPAFYSGFRVLIGRNRIAEGRIKKSFNTKAEALKFANEYMKKN